MKKFFFLAGLPRSGSTLLRSILAQNPEIHTEGQSALCEIMWRTYEGCTNELSQQALITTKKEYVTKDILTAIPQIYYNHTDKKYVIDKCRAWCCEANLKMIKEFITPNPKIIVTIRPMAEVVSSLIRMHQINDSDAFTEEIFVNTGLSLEGPISAVEYARKNNNGEFLFVTYSDLLERTNETLEKIYNFIELDPFCHDLTNIINTNQEDDMSINLPGMHDVRPTISKRDYNIPLKKSTIEICQRIDNELF